MNLNHVFTQRWLGFFVRRLNIFVEEDRQKQLFIRFVFHVEWFDIGSSIPFEANVDVM